MATREFWRLLLRNSVNLNSLTRAFRKIEQMERLADKTYKVVLERYPKVRPTARCSTPYRIPNARLSSVSVFGYTRNNRERQAAPRLVACLPIAVSCQANPHRPACPQYPCTLPLPTARPSSCCAPTPTSWRRSRTTHGPQRSTTGGRAGCSFAAPDRAGAAQTLGALTMAVSVCFLLVDLSKARSGPGSHLQLLAWLGCG